VENDDAVFLIATAQAVVAAAADFISRGLVPPPDTQIEGLYDDVMRDRYDRAAVMARGPAIVQVLNNLTIEQRTAWMMNNFQTDERYAHAWNIAQRAMNGAPVTFSLTIENAWQRRGRPGLVSERFWRRNPFDVMSAIAFDKQERRDMRVLRVIATVFVV